MGYGRNNYIDQGLAVYPNYTQTRGYEETKYYIMAAATYRISYPFFRHCDINLEGNASWMMTSLATPPLVNNEI